jgi:hypothetical protein
MNNPLEKPEEPEETDVGIEPATREGDNLRLRIKKKQQHHMLRQMLDQGGYHDLARIATISGGRPVYTSNNEEEY